MDARELYEAWAPGESPWSAWVKPVLFAHHGRVFLPPAPPPGAEWGWEPPESNRTALLVDLPGVESVGMGLRAARAGFRPVPVFNACPAPTGSPEVVEVKPILASLEAGAPVLLEAELSEDAPPAFLIDSERGGEAGSVVSGRFDNRSVVFATDFPSATFLMSRGIERVVVVRRRRLGDDLVEVLQDWRKGGLELLDDHRELSAAQTIERLELPSASFRWMSRLVRQVSILFLFRQAVGGGFGRFVPEASSTG